MAAHPAPQLRVTYEQLVNGSTRAATLTRMVHFLLGDEVEVTQARLQCAFAHADSPRTHRSGDDKVTVVDAYTNKSHVCRIWEIIGDWAGPIGYIPINGVVCT